MTIYLDHGSSSPAAIPSVPFRCFRFYASVYDEFFNHCCIHLGPLMLQCRQDTRRKNLMLG